MVRDTPANIRLSFFCGRRGLIGNEFRLRVVRKPEVKQYSVSYRLTCKTLSISRKRALAKSEASFLKVCNDTLTLNA